MLFVSRAKNLRVILKPQQRVIDRFGDAIIQRGIVAEFGGGKFMTDDNEMIDLLLHHPLHKHEFVCADDEEKWRFENEKKEVEVVTGTRAVTKRALPEPEPPAQMSKEEMDKIIAARVEQEVEARLKDLFGKLDDLKLPEPEPAPKEMTQKQ